MYVLYVCIYAYIYIELLLKSNELTRQPQSQCPSWDGRWCARHLWSVRCPPACSCHVLLTPHGTHLLACQTEIEGSDYYSRIFFEAQPTSPFVRCHQMQWPAVSTQRGPTRVPPHVWWYRLPCFTCREIWGNASRVRLEALKRRGLSAELPVPATASCGAARPRRSPPCWCQAWQQVCHIQKLQKQTEMHRDLCLNGVCLPRY